MKEKRNEEKLYEKNQSNTGFQRQRQGAKKILRKPKNDLMGEDKIETHIG